MRPGSHENSPQRTVFKGGRARSNTMAARTRLNAEVDDDGVVPSTLLQRPLSKSTSELSSPTAPHHGRDLASELAAVGVEPSHPRPLAAGSHTGGASVPQLAERLSMAQKTHSFFNTLKTRFARSRSKERRPGRRREDGAAVTTGGSGGGQGAGETVGRVRRDSTDYAADNSSEHSSSATPQTQSPRHRLFAMHHDSSRGSDPALARSVGGEVLPGDSPRLRARGIGRTQGDGKKDTALESGSVSALSASSPPLVAIVDEDQRRREACLRQHSFFQLRVHLKKGKDLVAKDTGGTSDPYVKFKVGGRLLYKSKTIYRDLNPIWDEIFTLPIEDPFIPVHIKVFDYDWGLQDDFMGSAFLDLTKLELNTQTDLVLSLAEPASGAGRSSSSAAAAVAAAAAAAMSSGSGPYLGEITMTVCITPKTQEDKDQYFQRSTKLADVNRRLKSQIWSSVVTIVLVEGRKLLPMDIDGLSDPYVKFRLGSEKYKSKIVYKSLTPSWLEQFDLHLYDDQSQELEISVWDKDTRSKDDFMGKCSIDLSKLERERTHRIWQELEDGAGALFLLLTISGTTSSETISDLSSYEENPRERNVIESRYSLMRTLHNLRDVGHLTVKVFRAQGLAAADLGGKSDPFCVLELVNSRLQTQTEYKTLAPCWQKIFTFNVKDINSVLEVTVYDEDRDHKVEFLGRVAIPLLRIHNGEKKWYALKDKKLHLRAKGNCPQILLEMTVVWNPVRGIIRTLNPKEEKYMQPEIKFKRQVFLRNVMRLKAIIVWFIDIGKYISSCFEWESIPRSIVSLVLFIVLCYAFEPYMVPIALLLVFLKYYIVTSLTGGWTARDEEEEPLGEDDDDEEDKDKEEKKSLKERLQAIQEVTQTVQNSIGYIASLGESIKNTFNFTVPYLSWLAICLLAVGAAVLYLVPMRFLIMLWGVNKFARKLVRPHTVPNNELLDFLSRVPDDEALLSYRELKPHPNEHQSERRRDNRKKHKTS